MTCLMFLAIMIKFNANIAMTEDNDKAFLEQTYAEMYRAMIAKDTDALTPTRLKNAIIRLSYTCY